MVDEETANDLSEERPVERALIASAGFILQAVEKAARGFAIYLPNNPLHEKFFEELRQKVESHLEDFGSLRLGVDHDSISCMGETIYTHDDLRENLAFRMYADGIRALQIDEGLEPRELKVLVDIIGRPPAEEGEDDIVTRLWGAELPHVSYFLAEVPFTGESAALGLEAVGLQGDNLVGARAAQAGAVRRYAAGLAEAGLPPHQTTLVPQQIFTISDEELASLQERMLEEERRAPIHDVAAILEAILHVEAETALFGEFVDIIGRLCADQLASGRVEPAVSLLEMLNRVAGVPEMAGAHVEKITTIREEVVSGEVPEALAGILAKGDGIERDLLRALIAQLGRAAVAPFCQILGEVPGKETRKVLIEALAATGKEAPELFLPYLDDERWYLVRNTIYILRRIATPAVTGAVRRCIGHRDARVRKEVLLYFDEVPDPSGEAVMIKLLDDEAPSLRMSAARSLARRKSRTGLERLLALTGKPAFEAREQEERCAVWEALAELAPARMLPAYRDMLLKRRLFAAEKELDDAVCAAAALRRMGTPEALALLKEAAAAKKGKARTVVEEAVRAVLRAGGGAASAPPSGEERRG